MMGIEIRFYPSLDLQGHISYLIGRLFRRMPPGLCHVTVKVYNGLTNPEYHATIDGMFEVLPEHTKGREPNLKLFYPMNLRELIEVHKRLNTYGEQGHRVTVGSLLSSLCFPYRVNPALCTSFAQYLLRGEVTCVSNNINKFIMELQWYLKPCRKPTI